jgi:putative ABC transport system substrate-binding protein
MMKRRAVVTVVAASILSVALAAEGQPSGKVWRLGMAWVGTPASTESLAALFRRALADIGYVEGQNLMLVERWAEDKPERIPDLMAELVKLKVNILAAPSNTQALAAKQATAEIPIVMIWGVDPVSAGLISSMARPGGNITGVTMDITPEILGKQLQLLKEVKPRLSRVGLLWDLTALALTASVRDVAEDRAGELGLAVRHYEARVLSDIDRAFEDISSERAQAVLVLGGPLVIAAETRITALALKQRLPTMFAAREAMAAGGLMMYGPSYADAAHHAAVYVDKILKGAKPAALPVEQPTKFELVINMKTAKTLGLTIPQSILLRADQVIE